MKISTFLSLSVLLSTWSFTSQAQCADSSNIHSFNYNGTIYELVRENVTWQGAAACALSRGGHLAEMNDASENIALYAELITNAGITFGNTTAPDGGGGSYVWIGGNDLATEGTWIWDGDNTGASVQFWQGTASGNPVGGLYNNWGNEPDDFNGQDALALSLNGWPLGSAGEWNDVDETNQMYFLIEYPSTAGANELENKLEIYPNPFEDLIHVSAADPIQEVVFRNTLGQEIKRLLTDSSFSIDLNVSDLESNLYLVELIFADGTSVVRKLQK